MSYYQVKVYHQVQPVDLTHIPQGPQDKLSWRQGNEPEAEPRHTQVVEAASAEAAKLKLLKEHPEFSPRFGSFQFDVRLVY